MRERLCAEGVQGGGGGGGGAKEPGGGLKGRNVSGHREGCQQALNRLGMLEGYVRGETDRQTDRQRQRKYSLCVCLSVYAYEMGKQHCNLDPFSETVKKTECFTRTKRAN